MKLVGRAALAAMFIASLGAACGDDEDEFGPVAAEWSIDGGTSQADCLRIGADLFELAFFARDSGQFIFETEEVCEAFTMRFEVTVGFYDVTARLITATQENVLGPFFYEDVVVETDVEAVLHADFQSAEPD